MNFNGFHNAIMFDEKMLKTRCKICVVWQVVCVVVFYNQLIKQAGTREHKMVPFFACSINH